MPEMEFTHGETKDARLLAELGRLTFWDTYSSNKNVNIKKVRTYMDTAFTVEQLRKELRDENTRFLLAAEERCIVGYAKLHIGKGHELIGDELLPLEIARIYLKREHIGKGLGGRLLGRCISEAEQLGCGVVWLSVWQYNEHAIRFYERNGFQKRGTHSFDLAGSEETDYLMARKVGI